MGEPEGADTQPGDQGHHQHHAHHARDEHEGDGEPGGLHRGAGHIASVLLGAGGETEEEEGEEGGDQAHGDQPHREQRVSGTRVQEHQAQAHPGDAVTQQHQPGPHTQLGGAQFIQRGLVSLTWTVCLLVTKHYVWLCVNPSFPGIDF